MTSPQISLLDILLQDAPEPAPVPKVKRHFYRCADCLSVVATESKIPHNTVCDACDGVIEYMGITEGVNLKTYQGQTTPCDHRCTNAAGPNCECRCGGANHGSGITVPLYTYGPIPRLGVPQNARGKAEAYRAMCTEYRAKWEKEYGALQAQRRGGKWLDRDDWARLYRGQKQWQEFLHAKAMRSAARNKVIGKLLGLNQGLEL